MNASALRARAWALICAAAVAACAAEPAAEPPQVDASAGAQKLAKLPRRPGERVSVTIYEFRSSVNEIPARGSTDMFKTALVQSGQFRVVERARLNEGVVREKQLSGAGLSKGKSASQQLTEARYIFEGSITEASSSENQRSAGVQVAGASVGGSSNRDFIGLDVRMVDVENGEIVAAVTVRKSVKSDTQSVSGLGSIVAAAMARKGHDTTFVPDVPVQQQRKESLDGALRAAIDEAVIQLANRFPQ